jgi:hypothetical protein
MEGGRTMERPWKQTIACRGVGESARKLRTKWEGDRWETIVRTGPGQAHRPGSEGACGNVDHGGTRHPPRVSQERVLASLRLKLCAPQLYLDGSQTRCPFWRHHLYGEYPL